MNTRNRVTLLIMSLGGCAVLICLLVGWQLRTMDAEIDQILSGQDAQVVDRLATWHGKIEMASFLALCGGLAILGLTGGTALLAHRRLADLQAGRSAANPTLIPDPDDVSVRIFEISEEPGSVPIELSPGQRLSGPYQLVLDPVPDIAADTDSIMASISELTRSSSEPSSGGPEPASGDPQDHRTAGQRKSRPAGGISAWLRRRFPGRK